MMTRKKRDAAIARIRGKRGLSVRIADALKIRKAAVYQWERVPPARVRQVAPLIDMTPEQIRPDIFGNK
jgi:hypothetical protein